MGQFQLVFDESIGVIAIEQTRPQTNAPPHGPACRNVTAMLKTHLCSLGKVGRITCRNLIAGEKPIEMADMAMVIGRVIPVLNPLLQLSPRANVHGSQFLEARLIMLGRSDIAEDAGSLSHFAPEVSDELAVHCTTSHRSSIVSLGSILRRIGGTDHQIMMPWLIDHRLVKETRCSLHHGIPFAQKILVERKEVMLPKMCAKPCATRHPHARRSVVNGARDAPQISVVMQHPCLGIGRAIHHTSCITSRLAHLSYQAEERLVEFGKIADLRGPIVHLEVDVAGVFAVPRGEHLVIPDALQVGRLTTGL